MKPLQKASFKFLSFLFLIAVPFIYSCKEKTPPKTVDSATESPATNNVAPSGNAVFSNDAVALNPAHGQPGHRCDILVGEPLNSPVKSLNTGTNPQSPVIINNSSNSNPFPGTINSGGITLNPAHGQPGHRCDIKVGEPLI